MKMNGIGSSLGGDGEMENERKKEKMDENRDGGWESGLEMARSDSGERDVDKVG